MNIRVIRVIRVLFLSAYGANSELRQVQIPGVGAISSPSYTYDTMNNILTQTTQQRR